MVFKISENKISFFSKLFKSSLLIDKLLIHIAACLFNAFCTSVGINSVIGELGKTRLVFVSINHSETALQNWNS
jgi:hypothetical protein